MVGDTDMEECDMELLCFGAFNEPESERRCDSVPSMVDEDVVGMHKRVRRDVFDLERANKSK